MKIAIIGGGVAGASVAIYLRKLGLKPTLFEKKPMLVAGPPACHLHAGGNLYPDIDDTQRKQLLKESIEFLCFYPQAIEKRPTLLAIPKHILIDIDELIQRTKKLALFYKELIDKDPANRVLGDLQEYFLTFSQDEVVALQGKTPKKVPKTPGEWLIPFANEVDINKLKFPVILVQEYGINIFRLSAIAQLLLQDADVRYETSVVDVKRSGDGFIVISKCNNECKEEYFDFLINAAGFKSGMIDDFLGYYKERIVEFKAAYIAKYRDDYLYPEMIFHGIRGTDKGMAQFTPYPAGYYQLHGMRKDITLFEDGVAKSEPPSSQPRLPQKYIEFIEKGFNPDLAIKRTQKAIWYVSRYLPPFTDATPTPTPLFGAQQIPGRDLSLRAAEVSFEGDRYARCEIVKVSSIFTMADAIVGKLIKLQALPHTAQGVRIEGELLDEKLIDDLAQEIAKKRGYPEEMAKLLIPYIGEE
ncbi:FAD-dependent oxidoreductase [Nitratiruptor tergarcus]|uniref:FAD dependent oxidoreductase n=1 Tax=Nitratiruptor tergarcus DSM 16512 TaxID=1069081 RepID=A0A1W1WRN3_9BACT|nr:FAD-dependent oxidoreductase [Nitratiruptor tergarcus]SMC08879.1 FAD dependent oxidoreductase [Nitratiruptor tergarcus DSM 16512]